MIQAARERPWELQDERFGCVSYIKRRPAQVTVELPGG